MDPVP